MRDTRLQNCKTMLSDTRLQNCKRQRCTQCLCPHDEIPQLEYGASSQYRDLQSELTRYVTASKGIANALLHKDNPDGIQTNAGKITLKGTCFNCGANPVNHRAAECSKPKNATFVEKEDTRTSSVSTEETIPRNRRMATKQIPCKAGNRFSRADRKKVIRTVSVKRENRLESRPHCPLSIFFGQFFW